LPSINGFGLFFVFEDVLEVVADKGVDVGDVLEGDGDSDGDVVFGCNSFNNDTEGPARGAGTLESSATAGRSA
jgi:hypothetical protein